MTPTREPIICACQDHAFAVLDSGHVTLMDLDDVDFFRTHKWRAYRSTARYYVVRTTHAYVGAYRKTNTVKFHRAILGVNAGAIIDHINRCGLDNRKRNLRNSDAAQNSRNRTTRIGTSKFRGVTKSRNTWMARITVNRKLLYIGRFNTEMEAAAAYDAEAMRHFGDEAKLYLNSRSRIKQ